MNPYRIPAPFEEDMDLDLWKQWLMFFVFGVFFGMVISGLWFWLA